MHRYLNINCDYKATPCVKYEDLSTLKHLKQYFESFGLFCNYVAIQCKKNFRRICPLCTSACPFYPSNAVESGSTVILCNHVVAECYDWFHRISKRVFILHIMIACDVVENYDKFSRPSH